MLENEQVLEGQAEEIEAVEGHEVEQQEETAEDSGEVVITFGDEPADDHEQETAQAPDWVKTLRKEHKELRRENKELKARQQTVAADPSVPKLGAKPKLEDHDYDAEAFEVAMDKWYDQKRVVDDAESRINAEKSAAETEWKGRIKVYEDEKASLRVADYEDAEIAAQENLSVTQQGIILQGADNPAKLIYALGKNSAKLKEIAAIKDPVKFSFAIAKLETKMKESTRSKIPAPEKRISGDSGTSGTVDSQLDRLREDAVKTGDMTKVMQYKAQQRAKNK